MPILFCTYNVKEGDGGVIPYPGVSLLWTAQQLQVSLYSAPPLLYSGDKGGERIKGVRGEGAG